MDISTKTPKAPSAIDTQELLQSFTKRTINRREFMLAGLALGLSTSVLSGVITSAEAANPIKAGRLRIGISEGAVSDSLDPATTKNQATINMAHTFRNFLTEISPENDLIGELAESWESNSDATEWHFKLRKDVEFHNGKTMDARDVIDSINHHRGTDTSSAAKVLLDAVRDIKADGNHAVTFQLVSGNADFPFVLTDYHLNIVPSNGAGGIDWQSGVGTGAYILDEFEPGVRTTYTRNPNYWKTGRGFFDRAEMLVIGDTGARESALVTGDIDVADQADLKVVKRHAQNPDIEVENVTSWAHVSIPMHSDIDPFTSNEIRLALKYGINRQELLDKILKGYGSIGNDHPISPVLQFYAELEQRTYDPDKAQFHLKKAGFEKLKLSLSTADVVGAGAVDAATLYREHLKPVGIDLEVKREPNDGYYSNVWLKQPFCMVSWGGRPTADVMFTTAYAEGAAWNESHFSHKRFNQLLVAARSELDVKKRADMYRDMQQIVRDECGSVIPLFRNHVYLRRANVLHGPSLSANWPLDGNRVFERWWLA